MLRCNPRAPVWWSKTFWRHTNATFSAAMTAAAGIRGDSFAVSTNDRSKIALEQTELNVTHVATGIWEDGGFVDAAFDNIKYKHVGHYAIGAPLSSDTIQELAGMTATFQRHGLWDTVNANGSETGVGSVNVQVDYANRGDADRNYWQLSGFATRSGSYVQNSGAPLEVSLTAWCKWALLRYNRVAGHFRASRWRRSRRL